MCGKCSENAQYAIIMRFLRGIARNAIKLRVSRMLSHVFIRCKVCEARPRSEFSEIELSENRDIRISRKYEICEKIRDVRDARFARCETVKMRGLVGGNCREKSDYWRERVIALRDFHA